MAPSSIDITAKPREQITVHLVDKTYLLTPPKAAFTLKIAAAGVGTDGTSDPSKMLEVTASWIEAGFGKKAAKDIQARLADPDDLLDFTHIMELLKKVAEAQTANPTS